MKKIKLFAFLAISAAISSCSSDGDSDTSPDTGGGNTVDLEQYFTYSIDNQDLVLQWIAIKSESTILVQGVAADGSSVDLNFNEFGDLSSVSTTPADNSTDSWKESAYNFSSHYFDFELVSLDTDNKMVKVNFGGKVYDDEFDLTSDFSTVEGSLNVKYSEVAPQVVGLGVTAKIQGNSWYSGKSFTTNNGDMDNIVLVENGDDEYRISLYLNQFDTPVGSYQFNAASDNNKVVLSKFDVLTGHYVEYTGVGTFKLDTKTDMNLFVLISGTYSFTATNPIDNSQIQVTEGTFKTVYTP